MKSVLYVGNLRSSFQRDLYNYLRLYGSNYGIYFRHSYFSKGRYVTSYLKLIKDLLSTIGKLSISDGVFVEFLGGQAYVLSKFNKPLIIRCHRFELLDSYWRSHASRIKEAARRASKIICVSNYIREQLISLIPNVEDRTIVIYNSVDVNRFRPLNNIRKFNKKEEKFIIGSLGSLIPRKGFEGLILVVANLIKDGIDVELWIGGRGPLESRLRYLAKKLGIHKNVKLFGFVPEEELPEWYNRLDLFCLNSSSEGLPTVVLEAMASGIPVVASRVGGTIEALGMEWTYEPGDLAKLKELIKKVYNMSARDRQKLGLKNREVVIKKFNLEINAKRILEIIVDVIGK